MATLTQVESGTLISIDGCQVVGPSEDDATRMASFFVASGTVAPGQRYALRVGDVRCEVQALEARPCKRGLDQVLALVLGRVELMQ